MWAVACEMRGPEGIVEHLADFCRIVAFFIIVALPGNAVWSCASLAFLLVFPRVVPFRSMSVF